MPVNVRRRDSVFEITRNVVSERALFKPVYMGSEIPVPQNVIRAQVCIFKDLFLWVLQILQMVPVLKTQIWDCSHQSVLIRALAWRKQTIVSHCIRNVSVWQTGRVNHSKKCLPRTKCLTGEDGEKPKEILVIDPDTEVCISHQILSRYWALLWFTVWNLRI